MAKKYLITFLFRECRVCFGHRRLGLFCGHFRGDLQQEAVLQRGCSQTYAVGRLLHQHEGEEDPEGGEPKGQEAAVCPAGPGEYLVRLRDDCCC